jgi:hypothetical protein
VLAYVLLLTDVYPPFRLDQGCDELGLPAPSAAAGPEVGGPVTIVGDAASVPRQ